MAARNLPPLIVLAGPTASGKSDLGVELALRYGGEIISADSRQVYKGLDIGSGKITKAETRGVPHYLIDVAEPGEFFSMALFQRLAYEAAAGILSRGKLPIMVGGTGLYIASVADGYVLSDIEPDLNYRRELETLSTPVLAQMLSRLSPFADIDKFNRNRVMRALEKLHDGDTLEPRREAIFRCLKLGTRWERETIYERIRVRLDKRFEMGMTDEVRGLIKNGVSVDFLLRLGLEYGFITRFLTGQTGEEEMRAGLLTAIRKFAKRQETWFRRDCDICWLDMTGDAISEAGRLIEDFLGRPETRV